MDGSCQSIGAKTMELGMTKMITAVKTMNGLGITTKTIRPVLMRLLNLYNDDWTLIEENNYRILTDALFDSEEAEEDVQNAFTVNEEVEPPLKKPNLGLPEDRGSSNMDNAIRVFGTSIAESSHSLSGNVANMDNHVSCPLVAKNKVLTNASHNPQKIKKRQLLSSGCNHLTTFQTTHDIAASNCGQVKVSLTCNRAVGQKNTDYPNTDEVLRYVENCYRKSYINEEDPFSMGKLLNRLCECYLKMGDDSISGETCISSSSGSFSQLESSVVSGRKKVVEEVIDIANGTEQVKISLLNDKGVDGLSNFIYCPESIVYQDACVQISMARVSDEDCCAGCKGDCMSSSSLPCACTRDTGGDFAYTAEGLLSEKFLSACLSVKNKPQKHEFYCNQTCPLERAKNADWPEHCKGHIVRKFIKECWRKCGCNMQCGNRVVQRGISRNLQVFFANGEKGWGVQTLEKYPAGAFICEFAGEIMTNIELYERNERNKNGGKTHKLTYPVLLDADWATEAVVKDEDALCLDATYYGNVARFINHRCSDGNLVEVPVQVETSDRRYYHLALFTSREVAAYEELTWDYGIDFDDHNHPIKAFKCHCGSKYCRDTLRFKY